MKKLSMLVIFVIATLVLSACGGGSAPASAGQTDEEMQAEIVQLLTSMVTATETPLATETFTPMPPTETPLSSDTPTVTPTEETVEPTATLEGTLEDTPEFTKEPPSIPTIYTPSGVQFQQITFTPKPGADDEEDSDSNIKKTPTADDDEEEVVSATKDPALSDPAEGLGDPVYEDDFSTGDNWSLGRDSYMDMRAANGKLVVRGLTTVSGWRVTRVSLANGYIELKGSMEDCRGADNYGLYFRVPNAVYANAGYLFGISCDGKYALRKWNGETMTSLIHWKSSDAINKDGETNTIGVKLDGYEIELYVNGEYIAKVVDDDYDTGSVGMYVAAKDSGDLTVLLDQLSVWKK